MTKQVTWKDLKSDKQVVDTVKQLASEGLKFPEVARVLKITHRNIGLRLKKAGTKFTEIRDEVKADKARAGMGRIREYAGMGFSLRKIALETGERDYEIQRRLEKLGLTYSDIKARERAVAVAEKEMKKRDFPKRYWVAICDAIRSNRYYHSLRDLPGKVDMLKDLAGEVDEKMEKEGIGNRVRLYRYLALPQNITQSDFIRGEIDRTITCRGTIFDELNSLEAPHKIYGGVAAQLMNRRRKTGESPTDHTRGIINGVREKTQLYQDLRKEMLARGHHDTIAGEMAVKCLFLNDPLGSLDGKLGYELNYVRNHRVKHQGLVKRTGLSNPEFIGLVQDSRQGNQDATGTLIERFRHLDEFSEGESLHEDARQDRGLMLMELIQANDIDFDSRYALRDFVVYAACAFGINRRDKLREKKDRKYRKGLRQRYRED